MVLRLEGKLGPHHMSPVDWGGGGGRGAVTEVLSHSYFLLKISMCSYEAIWEGGPARLLRSRFLLEKRPIFLVDPNFRNFLTGSLLTKYRIYDFHNWTSPEGSYGYRRFLNTLQNLTTFFLCTTVPNKFWVWSECPRLVVSFSHASLYLQSLLKHRRLGISGILCRANRASLVYQCF